MTLNHSTRSNPNVLLEEDKTERLMIEGMRRMSSRIICIGHEGIFSRKEPRL